MMVICGVCNRDQESPSVTGCLNISLNDKFGVEVSLVPFGREWNITAKPGDRCPDCNALYGQPHHSGCTVEICPFCGDDQMYACDCQMDDNEDWWDGDEDEDEEDDSDDDSE